ncbi:MAG: hypothetical protein DBX55_08180 [Verrucomicrobia bacterium]|nr:MAG: hypothetical protein DBX55_08180 [Verrucomicrobiota bacterium]
MSLFRICFFCAFGSCGEEERERFFGFDSADLVLPGVCFLAGFLRRAPRVSGGLCVLFCAFAVLRRGCPFARSFCLSRIFCGEFLFRRGCFFCGKFACGGIWNADCGLKNNGARY